MIIYKKATILIAREVPDGLTDEELEEEINRLDTDINLDLDNIGAENGCEYFSEHTIDELTDEDKESYDFECLEEQVENVMKEEN